MLEFKVNNVNLYHFLYEMLFCKALYLFEFQITFDVFSSMVAKRIHICMNQKRHIFNWILLSIFFSRSILYEYLQLL